MKYKLYIAFGTDNCKECLAVLEGEKKSNHNVEITIKEFDTLVEENAYLDGVDDAAGWLEYETFDRKQAKKINPYIK